MHQLCTMIRGVLETFVCYLEVAIFLPPQNKPVVTAVFTLRLEECLLV